MPRNPETQGDLAVVEEAESALPIEQWVCSIADSAEVHDYACPSYKRPRGSIAADQRGQ